MIKQLQHILDLSQEPFFTLKSETILMMNAAARNAFPEAKVGGSFSAVFPRLDLQSADAPFVCESSAGNVRYCVSAVRQSELLYLCLEPKNTAERGVVLTDSMMNSALSTLANIELSSERLRAVLPEDASEARRYLGYLDHNYYTLLRKARNLSMLCAYSSGDLRLLVRRFDLIPFCAELVSSASLLTRGACAPVEFVPEADEMSVCMDAHKIELLLLNLLSNSLLHTPPDGGIRVGLAPSESGVMLTVRDSGSGIPSEKLNELFHRAGGAHDLDSLCADAENGIGLELCRAITALHGGTLLLESKEGKGTCVRVYLPSVPPGSVHLMSTGPDYASQSIRTLLTELSGLLPADIYAEYRSE